MVQIFSKMFSRVRSRMHPFKPNVGSLFQELSGSVSAGGSEPDLNAVPSVAPSIDVSATSSEDDKPKDKGSK